MSWLSSIMPGPQDRRDTDRLEARQRAATRAKLVSNFRDCVQDLAALQAKSVASQQQSSTAEKGDVLRPLLDGDVPESRALYLALEQCLFHRIRTKDFGVLPFWAFLERVERLPMGTEKGARPGPRERRLASVRNTVGAVASFQRVSTPRGRARAWIRQCLVSKCLEACVAALLAETRLVQVFYEPTALARCGEGSTILLRLCSALESFDVSIDADSSDLDVRPIWPILDQEDEWDRRLDASADAHSRSHGSPRTPPATMGKDWFDHQKEQHRQRAAAAMEDKGDGWAQLDNVIATMSSTVDQAVHSLDEKLADLFGQHDDIFGGQPASSTASPTFSSSSSSYPRPTFSTTNSNSPSSSTLASGGRRVVGDGWVEIRGDDLKSRHANGHVGGSEQGWEAMGALHPPGSHAAVSAFAGGEAGLGRQGRRGKARVFGVPLEDLVKNPARCRKGLLDPTLGVPDAVLSLLEALSEPSSYKTPGIFVEEASESELFKVVKSLEKANHVPTPSHGGPSWLVSHLPGAGGDGHGAGGERAGGDKGAGGGKGKTGGVSPVALASALLFFLHRLPEPLLTFRRREAFLACEVIPDVEARVRNIKLLVEDLPWAHKPLLLALVDLFILIRPKHADEGMLDGGAVPTRVTVGGVAIMDETDFFSSGGLKEGNSSTGETDGFPVRDAAEALAPALLRPGPAKRGREEVEGILSGAEGQDGGNGSGVGWEEELAATSIVELILWEEKLVFEGLRAELALREETLSRKIKRLVQLQRMFAAKVYVERYAHLAVVISIWRRLEESEHELQPNLDVRREEVVLGLATMGVASSGEESTGKVQVSSSQRATSALQGGKEQGADGGGLKRLSLVDEDQDVRELESMFLGVDSSGSGEWTGEGNDPGKVSGTVTRGDVAAVQEGVSVRKGGMALAQSLSKQGSDDDEVLPRSSQLEFTIDEDFDSSDAKREISPRTDEQAHASSALEFESTEELLGSIAATLTPETEAAGNSGQSTLAMTKSELALVNLMTEAGEESGEFLATPMASAASGALSTERDIRQGHPPLPTVSRGHNRRDEGSVAYDASREGGGLSSFKSGFDDTLEGHAMATGSVRSLGSRRSDAGGATSGHGSVAPVKTEGSGVPTSSKIVEAKSTGASDIDRLLIHSKSSGSDSVDTEDATGKDERVMLKKATSSSSSERADKFSLGHSRWMTCSFASGLVLDKGGHASSVGRALRAAGSVLALDSINYFLWRYPKTATRTIISFARRNAHAHALGGGGASAGTGDATLFPTHAGYLTRMIAELFSLPPPASSSSSSATDKASVSSAVAETGKEDGSEPGDVCALRLALLPTWKLLDSPHAFQEAFCCGVLVMEACQTERSRGHGATRYQHALLETRRVLGTCFLHAPHDIEGFWAAAAVEGGVSLDPGDITSSPLTIDVRVNSTQVPMAGESQGFGENGSAIRGESLPDELTRVLGLSPLAVEEGELEQTRERSSKGVNSAGHGHSSSPRAVFNPLDVESADDRLAGTAWGDGISTNSDWLLGGETARVGMADSIIAENSGRRGATVVREGSFQSSLLRPSQVMSAENVRALAEHLPDAVSSCDWVNLFSDTRHGTSLKTLLARCAGWEPTLVVMEASRRPTPSGKLGSTASGSVGTGDDAFHSADVGGISDASSRGVLAAPATRTVFGGFASGSQWRDMGRSYAGDGQSFIFSFEPRGSSYGSVGPNRFRSFASESVDSHSLNVYKWAGSDRYFMTSDTGIGLGMGGGGQTGEFGFFVENDLRRGSTGRCDTFRNEPLVSDTAGGSPASANHGSEFDLTSIEVWGFRNARHDDASMRTTL